MKYYFINTSFIFSVCIVFLRIFSENKLKIVVIAIVLEKDENNVQNKIKYDFGYDTLIMDRLRMTDDERNTNKKTNSKMLGLVVIVMFYF